MDPVSQVDRLVMILRQRMLERSRSAGSSARRNPSREAKPDPAENLKALAAVEAVDDHQLRRALIQNILAEQFGARLINETGFQQVVERVTEALEQDETGSVLIDRIVTELREASR